LSDIGSSAINSPLGPLTVKKEEELSECFDECPTVSDKGSSVITLP